MGSGGETQKPNLSGWVLLSSHMQAALEGTCDGLMFPAEIFKVSCRS